MKTYLYCRVSLHDLWEYPHTFNPVVADTGEVLRALRHPTLEVGEGHRFRLIQQKGVSGYEDGI
jgi:hypothetical protein